MLVHMKWFLLRARCCWCKLWYHRKQQQTKIIIEITKQTWLSYRTGRILSYLNILTDAKESNKSARSSEKNTIQKCLSETNMNTLSNHRYNYKLNVYFYLIWLTLRPQMRRAWQADCRDPILTQETRRVKDTFEGSTYSLWDWG